MVRAGGCGAANGDSVFMGSLLFEILHQPLEDGLVPEFTVLRLDHAAGPQMPHDPIMRNYFRSHGRSIGPRSFDAMQNPVAKRKPMKGELAVEKNLEFRPARPMIHP